MPDYSKGLVYRIDCKVTGECYIGSTVQGLANRVAEHRKKYKHWKAGTNKTHCCSFPIIERNNFTYELIEYFPCNNMMELRRKEGEFQRSMPCVNKLIAGRTPKECYDDNRETRLARKRTKQHCEVCDSYFATDSRLKHERSDKHKLYLELGSEGYKLMLKKNKYETQLRYANKKIENGENKACFVSLKKWATNKLAELNPVSQ
jgi:hypothetical protein